MNAARRAKPVIGVVGGIGAGKSTVAGALVEMGCERVDADAIGHELLACPEVRRLLRDRWGQGVFSPDGSVDRSALGRLVFADAASLAELNRIMHPRMRAEMEEQIRLAQGRREVPAVVLDAAVLFEAGWDELCSAMVFVRAPLETRLDRVQRARGWDRTTLSEREKLQISLDSKARKCDYTVENSSSISHLHAEVRRLLARMLHGTDQPR